MVYNFQGSFDFRGFDGFACFFLLQAAWLGGLLGLDVFNLLMGLLVGFHAFPGFGGSDGGFELFDVEVIFFYPYAVNFRETKRPTRWMKIL